MQWCMERRGKCLEIWAGAEWHDISSHVVFKGRRRGSEILYINAHSEAWAEVGGAQSAIHQRALPPPCSCQIMLRCLPKALPSTFPWPRSELGRACYFVFNSDHKSLIPTPETCRPCLLTAPSTTKYYQVECTHHPYVLAHDCLLKDPQKLLTVAP